jgi:hypothetical protein
MYTVEYRVLGVLWTAFSYYCEMSVCYVGIWFYVDFFCVISNRDNLGLAAAFVSDPCGHRIAQQQRTIVSSLPVVFLPIF